MKVVGYVKLFLKLIIVFGKNRFVFVIMVIKYNNSCLKNLCGCLE